MWIVHSFICWGNTVREKERMKLVWLCFSNRQCFYMGNCQIKHVLRDKHCCLQWQGSCKLMHVTLTLYTAYYINDVISLKGLTTGCFMFVNSHVQHIHSEVHTSRNWHLRDSEYQLMKTHTQPPPPLHTHMHTHIRRKVILALGGRFFKCSSWFLETYFAVSVLDTWKWPGSQNMLNVHTSTEN